MTPWQTYLRGVVVDVTNPKVAIFFLAFLPQFADPARGNIVVPMKDGRRGNPILWPRDLVAEMQQVQGDVGARGLLQLHADRIDAVPCEDDAIFADVDTPEALRALELR